MWGAPTFFLVLSPSLIPLGKELAETLLREPRSLCLKDGHMWLAQWWGVLVQWWSGLDFAGWSPWSAGWRGSSRPLESGHSGHARCRWADADWACRLAAASGFSAPRSEISAQRLWTPASQTPTRIEEKNKQWRTVLYYTVKKIEFTLIFLHLSWIYFMQGGTNKQETFKNYLMKYYLLQIKCYSIYDKYVN